MFFHKSLSFHQRTVQGSWRLTRGGYKPVIFNVDEIAPQGVILCVKGSSL